MLGEGQGRARQGIGPIARGDGDNPQAAHRQHDQVVAEHGHPPFRRSPITSSTRYCERELLVEMGRSCVAAHRQLWATIGAIRVANASEPSFVKWTSSTKPSFSNF